MEVRFTIPNDFGRAPTHRLSLRLGDPPETVEGKKRITITGLRRSGALTKLRTEAQYGFRYGDIEMRLVRDSATDEWWIDFAHPDVGGLNTIRLARTACNYGGTREWFVCPGCEKRAGVLYKSNRSFRCRTCLKWRYDLQEVNYKSVEPTLMHSLHPEKALSPLLRHRQLYAGEPTKWARRYERMRKRIEFGATFWGRKYQRINKSAND